MNAKHPHTWLRPETALVMAALSLRLLAVQLLWDPAIGPRSYEHGEIAANIVQGEGFRVMFLGKNRLTSQQAPFYPYLLAGFYCVFGDRSLEAELGVMTLQCVAGAWLCLAVVKLTRAVLPGPPAVAWVAGWGAALYPPHVYMVTHLQVALWAALWIALLAAWTLSADPVRPWRTGMVAGLLGGLLLLTEPILAIALPILAIALWGRSLKYETRNASRLSAARPAIVMTLATCLAIAPWIVRNYLVHGEFVFIKSTFGYAFWQGNNAASFGTDKIPTVDAQLRPERFYGSLRRMNQAVWEARYETAYIDDLLLKQQDYSLFSQLGEPACCRILGARAFKFIHDNPARYAWLCQNRFRSFLLFDETNPKAAHPVYRVSTVVWLVLAMAGLFVTRRHWGALWPTYAIFAAVMLFHTLTITSARFRIPVEPLTFPWCAASVAQFSRLFARRGIDVGLSGTPNSSAAG